MEIYEEHMKYETCVLTKQDFNKINIEFKDKTNICWRCKGNHKRRQELYGFHGM